MKLRALYLTLLIGAIALISFVLLPTRNEEKFTYQDQKGNELVSYFYPGEQDFAVLIVQGFASNQVQAIGLVASLQEQGIPVMTVDYAGHGESAGALGFDNATSDYVSQTIAQATLQLMQKTGLQQNQIVLYGHSMGARGISEYLVKQQPDVKGVVLVGPNLDLRDKAGQLERETWPDWFDGFSTDTFTVPTLLMRGSFDEIFTEEMYAQLISIIGNQYLTTHEANLVFHTYEMYSSSIHHSFFRFLEEISGEDLRYDYRQSLLNACWLSIVVLSLLLIRNELKTEKGQWKWSLRHLLLLRGKQTLLGLLGVIPFVLSVWLLAGQGFMVFTYAIMITLTLMGFGLLSYYRRELSSLPKGSFQPSIVFALFLLLILMGLVMDSGIGTFSLSEGRWYHFLTYVALSYPFFLGQYIEVRVQEGYRNQSWTYLLSSVYPLVVLVVVFLGFGSWSSVSAMVPMLLGLLLVMHVNVWLVQRKAHPYLSTLVLTMMYQVLLVSGSLLFR
ncbi:MAG: alpha/beta hydrolase [Erysipelotrichaceae bacterium]